MRAPAPELAQYLPEPPARVLEVGCGRGELALALRDAGYDVLAIDPEAPEGEIFRRVTLEELSDAGAFDAAVARWSLHHIADLRRAVAKIASLAPLLVVEEFAWDLVDEPTGEWYEEQRRDAVAAGRELRGPPLAAWEEHYRGLHGFEAMRSALAREYVGRRFEPWPFLYRYLGGDETEALERAAIADGSIRALGFRWAGLRR